MTCFPQICATLPQQLNNSLLQYMRVIFDTCSVRTSVYRKTTVSWFNIYTKELIISIAPVPPFRQEIPTNSRKSSEKELMTAAELAS